MLFDLQIFSGGVYPPSATSRTISFLFPIHVVFGHHYRARNWTFDENHFLVSSYSSFQSGSSGENRVKKFRAEVGIKCHQSCLVALVFCTKLYIKLAVSLCSISQFSFPFNFRTGNALVLKFGTLPLSCLFSNTLLAIFDIILFRSRVIHRFVLKNGQN